MLEDEDKEDYVYGKFYNVRKLCYVGLSDRTVFNHLVLANKHGRFIQKLTYRENLEFQQVLESIKSIKPSVKSIVYYDMTGKKHYEET